MTCLKTILAALLIIGCSITLHTSAFCQTKLAIHATQAEVNEWNKRRVSSPYTDDWARIIAGLAKMFIPVRSHLTGTRVGH
jgi:hypothetical protein